MIKNKIIALAAVALLAGAAAPAFADDTPYSNGSDAGWNQFIKQGVIANLQQQGVNATDAERWGQYVRAYVKLPNGTTQQQFFDPDTLAPVNLG
ncbi:MAG TPA: hypothetical protein VGM83_12635 [Devosiaceae bacterium]|jgi:hypothetical protein